MDLLAFEHHLTSPQGLGHEPAGAVSVTVGGGSCCDSIRFLLSTDGHRVLDAGFTAEGCGAATAAGSAVVSLVVGLGLLDAARVGTARIAEELGGLSAAKLHAAELAADALGRALGDAARDHGAIAPPSTGERTLVALSGGVDSAVAAHLCGQDGETITVTLELWGDSENDGERSCCSRSAVTHARALAHRMGLPHVTLDLRREFRAGVVEPFLQAHREGETPNPCVGCNGHVRLDAMLSLADRLGCASLATGHYARVVERDGSGGALLAAAADPAKDQTYMLSALAPESLARMRFPLGDMGSKAEVRRLAEAAGLSVARRPDSQDLCFLAGTTRERFLRRHGGIDERPGVLVDQEGNELAEHRGEHAFTVGQRRGLGLSATGEPLFVLEKDVVTGRVVVGPRSALSTERVALRGLRLHRDGARVDRVKLRYRQRPLAAELVGEVPAGMHRHAEIRLLEPADGAAPGQVACLMAGETVIGWATITRRPREVGKDAGGVAAAA